MNPLFAQLQTMTPEQAMQQVKSAEGMSRKEIEALQTERLRLLVAYARDFSPFLQEKYAALPDNPRLADIPPTLRSETVDRFEDWVCDREITTAGAREFIADLDNLTNTYLNRYNILTTSGTTGVPLVLLRDKRHVMVNGALISSRIFGGGKLGHITRLTEPDCRSCGIIAGGGFHSSYISFKRMEKANREKGLAGSMLFLPVEMSLAEKAKKLNAFQPEMLGGYPSTLQVLALAQKEGLLNISPLAILCSAEHLSNDVLHLIEETFACPVMNNYCSSEAGEVAMLCPENHMHINDDWIIVEPVDNEDRPVPDGVMSDGVLVTNLANCVQPIIRYRLTDRVCMHHEQCPCGSAFPYMEIEGRKEDILAFEDADGKTVLMPAPYFILSSIHVNGCLLGQFIQRSPTLLEVRYMNAESVPRDEVGANLLARCRKILDDNGVRNVLISLCEEPLQIGKSGKIRGVFQDFWSPA